MREGERIFQKFIYIYIYMGDRQIDRLRERIEN